MKSVSNVIGDLGAIEAECLFSSQNGKSLGFCILGEIDLIYPTFYWIAFNVLIVWNR